MTANSSVNNSDQNNINTEDDGYDDEDDLITFQFESQTINFYYTLLAKYSKQIRTKYTFFDVKTRLQQEILDNQRK